MRLLGECQTERVPARDAVLECKLGVVLLKFGEDDGGVRVTGLQLKTV
jgi:hypothetical protein